MKKISYIESKFACPKCQLEVKQPLTHSLKLLPALVLELGIA